MARFVFATHAASAHVSPLIPVARELVSRGHEITWYTGKSHQAKIEQVATYAPPTHGQFTDFERLEQENPEIIDMNRVERSAWFLSEIWAKSTEGQYHDLKAICRPGDVLLADSGFWAANLLHEKDGVVWATVCQSPMSIPDPNLPPFGTGWQPGTTDWHRRRDRRGHEENMVKVFGPASTRINAVRKTLNLPETRGQKPTPYLFMQATIPSFEYPRTSLPGQVRFIGPLFPDLPKNFTPPDWWHELDTDSPKVLVTQGTSATNQDDLINPAVEALKNEVDVIVTGQHEKARAARFLPYAELMPKLSAIVTNGGYGTVQQAIAHGLPLVVSGQTEDKPEVCARVHWTGAGIDLKARRPSSRRIRDAVRKVLSDDSYRTKSEELAKEMAGYDAKTEAATLLEELEARQP
ncbi:glycosyl transferase [Lentzea sp. NBRC 105346]|nr:glycosyl transferase [Lentzea sp. NBRC 105346]